MLKPVILQPRTKLVETNQKRTHIPSITGNVNTVCVAEMLSLPSLPTQCYLEGLTMHQTSFPWQNNTDNGKGVRTVETKMDLHSFFL